MSFYEKLPVQNIVSMSDTKSTAEIAARFRIDEEEIAKIIAKAKGSRGPSFYALCNKTGRRAYAYSFRGAYLQANFKGFADYDIHQVSTATA